MNYYFIACWSVIVVKLVNESELIALHVDKTGPSSLNRIFLAKQGVMCHNLIMFRNNQTYICWWQSGLYLHIDIKCVCYITCNLNCCKILEIYTEASLDLFVAHIEQWVKIETWCNLGSSPATVHPMQSLASKNHKSLRDWYPISPSDNKVHP